MNDDRPDEQRSKRWVLFALAATGALVLASVVGVPWVVRRDLQTHQARCCEIAAAFERERPSAVPDGPAEVGQCLSAIVDGLESDVQDQLERGQVEHSSALRQPSEPLGPTLLDAPLSAETFAAVDRCAGARTARWRSGHGLAVQGLLERYTREAHLERDPNERLRRLSVAVELWVDVYTVFDQSIVGPVRWARELGATSGPADLAVRVEVAERMRALAASLPDVETATATFYCAVYGEVQGLSITDAWDANAIFGASLAMAAGTEPAPWGREPAESRLDRAIPTGAQYDQFAEPGSAYVAATLLLAAQHLDLSDETFLGRSIELVEGDGEGVMSEAPCFELVLPSALDDRELSMCTLGAESVIATRELTLLFRALRATARRGEPIPEQIRDFTEMPVEPPRAEYERSEASLAAWQQIGYEPPRAGRVALSLQHPTDSPPPLGRPWEGFEAGWRQARAWWRVARVTDGADVSCDGPLQEVRLWIDGPAHDPRARPVVLLESSEPAAERP